MALNIFTKLFGSRNERMLKQYRKVTHSINALEADYEALSDEELQHKTEEFKQLLTDGQTLDDILPQAFAVVREAGKRVFGMRHYDVQMIGGMALHEGRISEMRTGEGKTLVSTLPAYLNALSGKGVHVVTTNDYLAKRDSQWMGAVHEFLGLEVTCIQNDMGDEERQKAYSADITYATNHELGFDYLRDNMKFRQEDRVFRELNFALIDEVDSILVDEARMKRNIERLAQRAADLGVSLRPHLKTTKSVDAARYVLADGTGPATVSTLAEADAFAGAGITDILYAVGITAPKLDRVIALHRAGCDLTVLLDNKVQAEAVARASREAGIAIPAMIEIDSDGHRSGLTSGDPALLEIGHILEGGGASLRGVLCHAGGSYGATGRAAHVACAEQERLAVVNAAAALRQAGLPCPVVSVGSTPTAHAAQDLTGVTELRAGVYVFFDLVMAGIEVCTVDDIALSVLTTVIGHQTDRGWTICDAGWMAMSRDRGTAAQRVDQGYGMVCNEAGTPIRV